MHPSPAFRMDDPAGARAFVTAHPFAVLARNDVSGPVTALVPLVFAPSAPDRLIGHVARGNAFWGGAVDTEQKAVAVFQGPDAYVSASFYPSKAEHGRVVPTWNYLAVEVRGRLTFETDPNRLEPYIKALTEQMEAPREAPWAISDAPADYIERLSHAIVGFDLSVDDVTYVRKLSQNKPGLDADGAANGLAASPHATGRALADEMRQEAARA